MDEEIKIGKHTLKLKVDREDRKIANQELIETLEKVLGNAKPKRIVMREAVNIAIQLFQACTVKVGVKMDKPDFSVESNEGLFFDICLILSS